MIYTGYEIEQFINREQDIKAYNSIKLENLSNANLVDVLYIFKFCSLKEISDKIFEISDIKLEMLYTDPTPYPWRKIANKYNVIIKKDREVTVYIPIGIEVDKFNLELEHELATYKINYKLILQVNYNQLKSFKTLNEVLSDYAIRYPLLMLRRLIIDLIEKGGTDIHFSSQYLNKETIHKIQYRINREIVDSDFKLSFDSISSMIYKLVERASSTSSIDLDSPNGITTDIANLFDDDTVDLRLTGERVSAGFYVVIAVQVVTTTSKKIDELGFPVDDVKILKELAQKNEGLILNTGPMRSGKNTTIFGMINEKVTMPIRIIEYSNPVEVRMNFPQINYKGNISALKSLMRMAKKQDIDFAILNEIPNQEVAFAVRDLVNSAVGVITTTHLTRVWHLPYKLEELYGKDYKTIISQVVAVINHRMFRQQILNDYDIVEVTGNEEDDFLQYAYHMGVRRYFQPKGDFKLKLQPLLEILVMNDELRTFMLNNNELSKSEQFIKEFIFKKKVNLEYKLVSAINDGLYHISELKQFYTIGAWKD